MPLTVELMNKIKVTSHLTWKSDPEKLWLESPPNGIHGFFFLWNMQRSTSGGLDQKRITSLFRHSSSLAIRFTFELSLGALMQPQSALFIISIELGQTKNFDTFFPSFIIYYFSFYFMPYTKNIYENCS